MSDSDSDCPYDESDSDYDESDDEDYEALETTTKSSTDLLAALTSHLECDPDHKGREDKPKVEEQEVTEISQELFEKQRTNDVEQTKEIIEKVENSSSKETEEPHSKTASPELSEEVSVIIHDDSDEESITETKKEDPEELPNTSDDSNESYKASRTSHLDLAIPSHPDSPVIRSRFQKPSRLHKVVSARTVKEDVDILLGVLRDPHATDQFNKYLPPEGIDIVNLWRRIDRYLELSASVDSIVTNNMVLQICKDFVSCENIPDDIREHLDMKGRKDIEDRTILMQGIHEKLLTQIHDQFFPLFPNDQKKRKPRKRKLTKSIQRDPFEDNDAKLIRFAVLNSGERTLIACTAEKIIHILTSDGTDLQFANSFILTYSYYSQSAVDFLDLVSQRFLLVAQKMKKASNSQEAAPHKIILLKVVNLLKNWIDMHTEIIRNQPNVIERLKAFAEDLIEDHISSAAKNLLNFLDKKLNHREIIVQEDMQFNERPPKMLKLKGSFDGDIQLEVIPPLEFARQMALVDHKLYRAIQPDELLHLNWTRKAKSALAPNVLNMITQFNRVGEWVIHTITKTPKESSRVKLLAQIIEIAFESYKLGNFNGAMALMSGLKHFKVVRMKETWDQMPSTAWDMWEEINTVLILDDNFSSLRKKMKETTPPLIPYLVRNSFLSGLTFKDAEPNFTKDGLINIPKLLYVANVVFTVKEGQVTPFCLEPNDKLQHFIETLPHTNREAPRRRTNSKRRISLLRGGSLPSMNKKLKKPPSNLSNLFTPEEAESSKEIKKSASDATVVSVSGHRRTQTLSPRSASAPQEEVPLQTRKKNRRSLFIQRGSRSADPQYSSTLDPNDKKKNRMSLFRQKHDT